MSLLSKSYGIYPLLPGNMTYLLVFDFDDHNNYQDDYANKDNGCQEEFNALRTICAIEKIPW